MPYRDVAAQRQLSTARQYSRPLKEHAPLLCWPLHGIETHVVDYRNSTAISDHAGQIYPPKTIKKQNKRLHPKIHLMRETHHPNCRHHHCNPLLLVTDNLKKVSQDPKVYRDYGLGEDVTGQDPLDHFMSCPNSFTAHTSYQTSPVAPGHTRTFYAPTNSPSLVKVNEVANLKYTIQIEIRYRETNAWLK